MCTTGTGRWILTASKNGEQSENRERFVEITFTTCKGLVKNVTIKYSIYFKHFRLHSWRQQQQLLF